MRSFPKSILAILFLMSLPWIPGGAVPGHAESVREPLPASWSRAAALTAVASLPDREFPLAKTLVMTSSLVGAELTGVPVDPAVVEKAIVRLAERVRPALQDRRDPRKVLSALNRFLFDEEGFAYDCVAGNPENFLLDRVIARKRGNCLGLTAIYLILADRLSLPLHGVYVPSHCFVRYEEGGVRINIETGEKGADREDGRYIHDFGLTAGRPYLRSLGRKEMIAVYLKSLGAALSRKGMEDRAVELYRDAAVFYPGLPDLHFNAGVSFHKRGLFDEAIAEYRRALDLDPDLAVARDNIGVALAKQGRFQEALVEARRAVALSPKSPVSRGNLAATLCAGGMVEEGIREFRKVLEIDPDNARALAGLTNAHYARGEFRAALAHCDRARERGCDFDPVLLGTLEKYREPAPASLP